MKRESIHVSVLYEDIPSDAVLAIYPGDPPVKKNKRRKPITETIIINLLILSLSNVHFTLKIKTDHFKLMIFIIIVLRKRTVIITVLHINGLSIIIR